MKKVSKVLSIVCLFISFSGVGYGAEIKQGITRIKCDRVSKDGQISSFNAVTYVSKVGDKTTFSEGSGLFVSLRPQDEKGVYVQAFKGVEFSLEGQDVLVIKARDFGYTRSSLTEFAVRLGLASTEADNGSITKILVYQFERGQFEDNGAMDLTGEPIKEITELGKFGCKID